MNKATKIIFSIMLAFILGVGCFVGGIKVAQHKEAEIQEAVSEDSQDIGYRSGYDRASEEKSAEIADLEVEISELEEMLAELQTQLENVRTEEEYNTLVAQITALNTQISTLQAQLAAAQAELAEYETLKEQRKYGLFTDDGKLIMSFYDMLQADILKVEIVGGNYNGMTRGINFDPDLICGNLVLPFEGRGATAIGAETFKNTTKLKSIKGDLFYVGESAFENSGIEKAQISTIWGAQTIIDKAAFKNCTNLTDIAIGATIEINKEAFYGCSNLSNIFNDYDEDGYEYGIFSNQIRRLGDYAFAYSGISSTISFTDGVVSGLTHRLGKHVYEGCGNLTSVVVRYCGEYQFKDCINLTTAYIYCDYPQNAFQGCTSLVEIIDDRNA